MLRNANLDYLKVFLAFMVVGIHAGFLLDINPFAAYLTSNGLFRIAVPVFLLINGFYFYEVLLNENAPKWFRRAIYLYAFWMLFYAYFWFRPEALSLPETIKIIRNIIIGYHHLWYISGMIGAAVLLYFLRNLQTSILIGILLSTFIIGVFIQYAGNYHVFEEGTADTLMNEHWVHRNFLFLAFPFFCLGFLINKFDVHTKLQTKNIAIFSALGVALLCAESYINFSSGVQDDDYDNLISLIIAAPMIFLLTTKSTSTLKTKNIALFATSIYLIHPFILTVLRKVFEGEMGETMLTIATIFASLCASIAIIAVHKKIRFIL